MNTSNAEFLASKADTTPAPTKAAPEMIGAEMLVHALHAEGVEFVWGYPGGAVLFIYDEIYKQDKFEHILVRHEQAAVHAVCFARCELYMLCALHAMLGTIY